MTLPEKGIVQPVRTRRSPELGPLAIMAATEADFRDLRRSMDLQDHRNLFLSRLCFCAADHGKPALVGPVMGAPYAVMLMETLLAWGVKKLLFYGWCGSISSRFQTGDILLPDGAIVDEGTSRHYHREIGETVTPHAGLHNVLGKALDERSIRHSSGRIWSTDGIFRETPSLVKRFQHQGAVAVDMELSALLSVALFHAVPVAGILVISDELFDLKWRPGFNRSEFKTSRGRVCDLLAQWNGNGLHE